MARIIRVDGREYREGQAVLIQNIKDPGPKMSDRDLNGKIGKLTEKFPDIPFGVVGVYITGKDRTGQKIQIRANLNLNEFTEKV